MAIAVYCALKYENDFDHTLQAAVNINGDSDTVAAVTGNTWGARKGITCIGRKQIELLHLEEHLKVSTVYDSSNYCL